MPRNDRSAAPIGVFDSGIGGLTVVRALRARLPGENIVYFGDTARVPYGTKSADTITRFAVEDAEFLVGRGVKLLVVACHSASSVALPELERRFGVQGGIPVLGVIEPGARALVAASRSGRVAVIGTTATIKAAAYERAIRVLKRGVEVVAKPTPLFVPLAEEGWLDNEVAEAVARRYLAGLAADGVDALLLGCTHFPLLTGVIARVMGPGVRLIDSSEETAAEVQRCLQGPQAPTLDDDSGRSCVRGVSSGMTCGATAGDRTGTLRVYLSDLTPSFEAIGARFLGEPLGDVLRASVGGQ